MLRDSTKAELDEKLGRLHPDHQFLDAPIPLDRPQLPPMPADIFYGWLHDIIEAVSAATETPRELAAMAAVGVLGTVCQKRFCVSPHDGYVEPLNIWMIAALESGNRKSAVFSMMTKPLLDWEREQAEKLQGDIKEAKSKQKTYGKRIDHLRNKAARAKDNVIYADFEKKVNDAESQAPSVPSPPQLWTQDITPEQLAVTMAANDERMAVLSAEGGIFEIIGGRYNNNVPNLDLFLQAHAGEAVRVERISRAAIYLEKPALTLVLSPQPDVIRGLASKPNFRGRGLLARFLYALPVSPLGYRTLNAKPVPESIVASYDQHIRALLDGSRSAKPNDKLRDVTIGLSENARGEWRDFCLHIEKEMREGGRFEHIKDWASKLQGASLRLAGLLHCAENVTRPTATSIQTATMNRALKLSFVLANHALAAFDLMGTDKSLEAARTVWRWVERHRHTSFRARDCFSALKGSFQRMTNIQPAFEVLCERNHLIEATQPATRGRPSKVFTVHPSLTKDWV